MVNTNLVNKYDNVAVPKGEIHVINFGAYLACRWSI